MPKERIYLEPISFRVSREEHEAIKEAAAAEHRSVSSWLRYHIVTELLPKGAISC